MTSLMSRTARHHTPPFAPPQPDRPPAPPQHTPSPDRPPARPRRIRQKLHLHGQNCMPKVVCPFRRCRNYDISPVHSFFHCRLRRSLPVAQRPTKYFALPRKNISPCSCIEKNCKGIGENDNAKPSLCAKQAKPFFMNPEGYTKQGSLLLLINGQFEPTLEITADTWVRLRLGFLATGMIL